MISSGEELSVLRYGAVLRGERGELLMVIAQHPRPFKMTTFTIKDEDKNPYGYAYHAGEISQTSTDWLYEIVAR